MVHDKPTPEEQLLKLIENPDAASKKTDAGKSEKPTAPAKRSPGAWIGDQFQKLRSSLTFSKRTKQEAPKVQAAVASPAISFVHIRWLSRLLLAMVLAASVYLILDLFVFKQDQTAYLAQVGTVDKVYPTLGKDVNHPPELPYYLSPLEKRNPFLAPGAEAPKEEEGAAAPAAAPAKSLIQEKIAKLSLVGISWADQPMAMIEDTGSGRTYFVREGQNAGEVKVQSITNEKVVVTYEGEEADLY